ncbi:hypothetical protein [Novosphingobium album (ex Hu et al. 2023)]|uniref:HIRAN domain-containing protein n=1 Tax=Novosphingobium album (ex Hu et al. 2023) TaxID=2930093 RepID=A0ABT0AWZ8_9SPHN|nr:hypothetical protein [Novosphingobium album (ex Hu et al. 2023)]MCJ2177325.1 hypothetical protein [Novosphingobium album (ex Hu et al. 2023)]
MLEGFFKGLNGFSRRPVPDESAAEGLAILLHGSETYALELAGTARRQAGIRSIFREKARSGRRHSCIAVLSRDCDAPPGRVSVEVYVDGILVGHFPRYLSSLYCEWLDSWNLGRARVHCRAVIQSEWFSAEPGAGECRVKLDLEIPFKMTTIAA